MSLAARTGIVAFLFTDIEGSTRLWEQHPDTMSVALAAHDAIATDAVMRHHGTVVKFLGDGLHASFDDPLDALEATLALQLALANAAATGGIALRVRCGLHVGVVEHRDNDFFGSAVNRAARIMGMAHGGQMLLSDAVAVHIEGRLPATVSLRDLGHVRLRDLTDPEHIYQVLHRDLRADFPALRSLQSTPNNLPQQMTSFLGRERELQELKVMLMQARLLTLLGTGGIGKTRLCLQLAEDVLDTFPDGAWWVDLASVTDPGLVPNAVAHALGLTEIPGTPFIATLRRHAAGRQMLLLLDNCEHMLEACAELVDGLITAAPALRIIATSRERLRLQGEQTYMLPTLSLAAVDADLAELTRSDAAQLFIDRARLRDPHFTVHEERAPVIARICAQLDGIPLALELAAAWVGMLSLEAIDARLDDRFRLLTHGTRTALPRQQTLRALIDWSFDLLDADEKKLFARLSVFAGGWTLDAVEAVCAADDLARSSMLDVLDRVIQKSLVLTEEGGDRYRMLETLRAYGRGKLSESGSVDLIRRQHHEYFLALAEASEPAWLNRENEAEWLSRLDLEHENIKTALRWSLEARERFDSALRICGAMGHFWRVRGHWREGRTFCAAALAGDAASGSRDVRAKAMLTAALLTNRLGESREAESLLRQSLALTRATGNRALEAGVLNNLGNILADHGDIPQAHTLLATAVAINRELGNHAWETINLGNIGEFFVGEGNFAAARPPFERALALSRELGNRSLEAAALSNLGLLAERLGDYGEASSLAIQSHAIYRELGAPAQEADQLGRVASAAAGCGDLVTAAHHFADVLRASQKLGYRRSILHCFEGMVVLASKTQDWERSAVLWGAAQAQRTATGVQATPSEAAYYGAYRDQCRAAFGDAAFNVAETAGRAMLPEIAIAAGIDWLAALSRSLPVATDVDKPASRAQHP